MNRPTAILFDVYDTLVVNDREGWVATFDEICKDQALPIGGQELWQRWKKHEVRFRALRTNLQDPTKTPPFKTYQQAWRECFELVFAEAGIGADAARAARRSVEHMSRRTVCPDTRPALEALGRRVRLGVFSNADDGFLLPLLEHASLSFETVASSESARVYKPSPAAFRHILGLMDLRPEQAWYVGDQLFDDVQGAKSVGLTAIWINRNGSSVAGDGPTPDATISDLRQLVGLLTAPAARG